MSDGKCLDPGEVLSPEAILANENHEGKSVIEMTLSQLRWYLSLANSFDKYDKNLDGFIDKNELNTAQRQDKLKPQLSQRLQSDVLMKFGSTMNNDRFRGLSLQDINALTDTK
jgi:Ca2+-binding EF-hand superfamily protein